MGEYRDLVCIVSEQVSFESFLTLMSKHQSTLSPPGKGHDCFRTWQAIAVGTVPLVVDDPMFDPRLYAHAGSVLIPHPDDLTPEVLRQVLLNIRDPVELSSNLDLRHWEAVWSSHLPQT